MAKQKRELPKYCYARRNKIWLRVKDEAGKWVCRPTPYTLDQVDLAREAVRAAMRRIEARREAGQVGRLTVRVYATRWVDDRETRGIVSALDERARLERYVFPYIGNMLLEEVRPRHLRDMVRSLEVLRRRGDIAPRTVIHVFRAVHSMYESAIVEEIVSTNPCILKKGELPKKTDKDPEWRARATYTVREVERLISDADIPVERRVMYALKAVGGLRHGEAAAACWRHYDAASEPLGKLHVVQSYNSRVNRVKSTKTEETRVVPVHPTLAKILAAWKLEHWERVYGRRPGDDDFIVPARTLRCVSANDANEAMKRDFETLQIRREAGKHRDRGGHDLRGWYKTRMIEDGADSLIVRRTTHAAPKDVDGGYERFSWSTVCREVTKLKVEVLDGRVLELATRSLHAEASASARWRKLATPTGFEAGSAPAKSGHEAPSTVEDLAGSGTRGDSSRARDGSEAATRPRSVDVVASLAALEDAIRSGDQARSISIIEELRALGAGVPLLRLAERG